MAYIKIPFNGENDKEVKSIGDLINYYVDKSNFTSLDLMYKKSNVLATIEEYFNDNKENIYIENPLGSKNYNLIGVDAVYDETLTYYMEDGTIQEDCPICNGDGIISINEKDPEHPEDFTCPKCNGKGKLIKTSNGVEVLGITINQVDTTPTGYSINYKIVPYETTSTILINDKDVL